MISDPPMPCFHHLLNSHHFPSVRLSYKLTKVPQDILGIFSNKLSDKTILTAFALYSSWGKNWFNGASKNLFHVNARTILYKDFYQNMSISMLT